jgi:hypothetical protein
MAEVRNSDGCGGRVVGGGGADGVGPARGGVHRKLQRRTTGFPWDSSAILPNTSPASLAGAVQHVFMGKAEVGHRPGAPERHRIDGRHVRREGMRAPAGAIACSA